MSNPIDLFAGFRTPLSTQEKIEKISNKLGKGQKTGQTHGEILLGVAKIEDLDMEILKEPEFLPRLASNVAVTTLLERRALDAVIRDGIDAMGQIINDPNSSPRDRTLALATAASIRNKLSKETHELIDALAREFGGKAEAIDYSNLTGSAITAKIFEILQRKPK